MTSDAVCAPTGSGVYPAYLAATGGYGDEGKGNGVRYVIGVVLIILLQLLFAIPIVLAGRLLPQRAETAMVTEIILPFLVVGIGSLACAIVVQSWHQRDWRSLIAPDRRIDWALLFRAAGLWLGMVLPLGLLGAVLEDDRIDWANTLRFAQWLPVLIPVLLLQTAAEEMSFRGYLSQGLYRLYPKPLFAALAVAPMFALAHAGLYTDLPNFALIGVLSLLFSAVTWRANRLEVAIGVHLAQNLSALLLVSVGGATPDQIISNIGQESAGPFEVVGLAAFAALYYYLAFGRGWVAKVPSPPQPAL